MEIFLLISGIIVIGYVLIIGIVSYGVYKHQSEPAIPDQNQSRLRVSILLACRNEEQNIGFLLNCLEANTLQEGDEIVIVNDDSGDNTVKIIKTFAHLPIRLFHLQELNPGKFGKKHAIALGLSKSTGDLILLTDADCRPGKKWVSAMRQSFTEKEDAPVMVLAPVLPAASGSLLHQLELLEFGVLMTVTEGSARLGNPILSNASNVMIKRDVFIQSGAYTDNFHLASGDDMFLLEKIKKQFGSHRIQFNSSKTCIVYTPAVTGLQQWISQRLRWVSKSKGYRDLSVLFVAGIIYGYHALLLGYLLLFPLGLLKIFFILFSIKVLTDMPLVAWSIRNYGNKKQWWLVLPAQLGGIFYVGIIGILGQVIKPRWKGRKLAG